MRIARRLAVLAGCLGVILSLSTLSDSVPATAKAQGAEPTLGCGSRSGWECSYILWDAHGSRGFVVPEGNPMPIGRAYLGFKFCMHAQRPRSPMPKWPQCWKGDNRTYWTPTDTYGIIKPGQNS